jgi:hypothetical protein
MTFFVLLAFANVAPKYHMRIGFIFVQFSLPCLMVTLFQFTDLLQTSVKNLITGRQNMALPTLTVQRTSFLENKAVVNRADENAQCENIEISKYRQIKILK